jgi:hypothetical protein
MAEPRKHSIIVDRLTPTHHIMGCACGWSTSVIRKQNARARASKIRAAIRRHFAEVASTQERANG